MSKHAFHQLLIDLWVWTSKQRLFGKKVKPESDEVFVVYGESTAFLA